MSKMMHTDNHVTGRAQPAAYAAGAVSGALAGLAVSLFKGSGASSAVLCCLLCGLVCGWGIGSTVRDGNRRRTVCCLLPAVFFACACLVGFSFATDSTPERLYGSAARLMRSGAALVGYSLVFFAGLNGLFHRLEKRTRTAGRPAKAGSGDSSTAGLCAYAAMLCRRPFATSFLTMLIGYIPYMTASWPALFMGDCQTILPQGFGYAALTTHHPVPYTLFLCGVIKTGLKIFGSWNAAVFLFSLLQLLVFLAVMAFGIRLLIREASVSWRWAAGLELWFILGPRVSNCMFVITKDVYYAAFLLLLAEALFLILRGGWTPGNTCLAVLAASGVLIFRKDGFYVLIISFMAFLLLHRGLRKRMPLFLLAVLGLHLLFNQVVYPVAGIQKGSVKEMLSIPMQQTARCAKYLGDSLTEEEKNEILDMFSFDSIEEMGAAYDPSLVDYIKFRFPEQVDDELLHRYLRLWLSMGRRYPATYVNAFLNNYFEYVYPGCIFMQCSYDWSETCFSRVNEKIGSDFSYPAALDSFRHGLESFRERVFESWPFRLLNMPGTTTWYLLIWTFWLLYRRDRDGLMLAVPMFVVMLICIASPCNGYYCRYQYPLLVCMPWSVLANAGRHQTGRA